MLELDVKRSEHTVFKTVRIGEELMAVSYRTFRKWKKRYVSWAKQFITDLRH